MKCDKRLLIIVNVDWFFVSHRLDVGLEALASGYEVHLLLGSSGKKDYLENHGFFVHELAIARGSSSIFTEVKTFISILRAIRRINPCLVHLVTIKPVLYGGIICKFLNRKGLIIAFSGLGSTFSSHDIKSRIRRFFIRHAYKTILKNTNSIAIFQNDSDLKTITDCVNMDSSRIYRIPGSGVDLNYFRKNVEKGQDIIVTMTSRLLYQKGVLEFLEAAESIKTLGYRNVVFFLVGRPDYEVKHSVTKNEYESWKENSVVKLLGHREDVTDILQQSSIFVLPSYYGEGLSKSLLEAAACGLPIITTNIPGCREAVIPDVTGILVEAQNAVSLTNAIVKLINDSDLRTKMGRAARQFAEDNFDVKLVAKKHISIYDSLLARTRNMGISDLK